MLPAPLNAPLRVVMPLLFKVSVVPVVNEPVLLKVMFLLPLTLESAATVKAFVNALVISSDASNVPPLNVRVPVPNGLALSLPTRNVPPPMEIAPEKLPLLPLTTVVPLSEFKLPVPLKPLLKMTVEVPSTLEAATSAKRSSG